MNAAPTQETVDISPGVAVLSILKYIEYDHWYAIAEFIDNAVDSCLKNKDHLVATEGPDYQLEVSIEIDADNKRIVVRDNAAGIAESDYARAFRAAERPPDNSKLSEFGMGMKTAACWYSDLWTVRTTALGEAFEKTVQFDLQRIFHDKLSELAVKRVPASPNIHYTVIELSGVTRMPKPQTLVKIKRHIESIYREFIRTGLLALTFNGERLGYIGPAVLEAPLFSDRNGEAVRWYRPISFEVEPGLGIHGFVAIREQGSTSEAGLALFRRGRVIQGSYDQAFRPEIIFGKANSYRYQRVFGELHLDGFQVSFTKKGFQADENMNLFLEMLHDELSHEAFPLLKQAEGYRVRSAGADYARAAGAVLRNTVAAMGAQLQDAVGQLRATPPLPTVLASQEVSLPPIAVGQSVYQTFELQHDAVNWEVSIELSYAPSLSAMYEVGDVFLASRESSRTGVRQIGIRLSLTHPFMVEFVDTDKHKLETVLRMVAALGLAEVIAKASGASSQKEIRRNFNELISKLTLIE